MLIDTRSNGYLLRVNSDEVSILIEALSALKSADDDLLKRDVMDKCDRLDLEQEREVAIGMRDQLTAATDLVREIDSIDEFDSRYL